jgi:cardiolipin synthase A/B
MGTMTTIRLLKNGVEAFPAMFHAVDQAESSIALEMYIIADDETGRLFREHLIAAAKRAVQVQILVDAFGSWNLPDSFWDDLRSAGGTVRWFHPLLKGLLPFRNHRKLLLIDDFAAYIGGMNIANEYYRGSHGELPWRDNVLEISGPETVRLRRSFLRMWAKAEQPYRRLFQWFGNRHRVKMIIGTRVRFLESGPENPLRLVRKAYQQIVQNAVKNLDLAMSYFYPHGRMLYALRRAAGRGVHVRLLFPSKIDVVVARWAACGLYGRLLRAGVEVWEYEPAILHAKLAIADDIVAAGSANLDIRSGRINHELVAVVSDAAIATRARADFEDDLLHSHRILLEEWEKRPVLQKIKERISYFLLARTDIYLARFEMARKKK